MPQIDSMRRSPETISLRGGALRPPALSAVNTPGCPMRIQNRFVVVPAAVVATIALCLSVCTPSVLAFSPQAEKEKEAPPPQPPTLEEQMKEIDEQIKEVDEDIAKKPKDLDLLKLKAAILTNKAQILINREKRKEGYAEFEEVAKLWKKIKAESKEMDENDMAFYSTAIYNLACTLSLKKEIAPALEALKESIDSGFEQVALLKEDTDLDNLRKEADFKKLVEALVKKRIERAKKEVSAAPLFEFDFKLPDVKGKHVSLGDFANKVVIVDVWGTWCPPCRKEIPHFVELHKKYKDKGFDIVGLNYEDGEEEEVKKVISEFAQEFEIPYSCLIGDEETQKKIPEFEGFPTTLFVDRKGKVRAKIVGYHELDVLEAMLSVLLEEPASASK
jgi:thiol-disulfide isomerase/thioredoxin